MEFTERLPIERLNALKNITYAMFKELTPRCKTEKERKEYFKRVKDYTKNSIRAKGVSKKNYFYAESSPSGRLYSGGSIQGICADIRGFLFRDLTTDIDIQNCHPKILEFICKKHSIDCPNLSYYNQNRTKILDRIGEGAKELFLKSVNSDKRSTVCKDSTFRDFDKEVKTIQQKLYALDEYKHIVQTVPRDKSYNCMGSAINRILCHYENICLQKMVTYLTLKNIEVCALMFDGCMVYGNYYSSPLLSELQNELSDYDLVLTYKQHSQTLNQDDFPSEDEDEELVTDLDATLQLLTDYPYWKQSGDLHVFDERNGMWTTDRDIHMYYITKYATGLHKSKTCLVQNILKLLPSQCLDSDWSQRMENTSLFYLLFSNGYYSFKDNTFHREFNPDIYFYHRIHYEYPTTKNPEYEQNIRERIFHQQHGVEMGNYLIELFARGLAGECLKNVLFGLGDTDTGKSFLVTIFTSVFEDYVGNFSGECLAYSKSTADEASKMRWAMLEAKRRLIFSSEINTKVELNGNLIKKLSSGGADRLVGRGHSQSEKSFKCHFLPVVMANDLPQIRPYDNAMDNRTRVFAFDKIYSLNPNSRQLQLDTNLENEIKTIEFKHSFLMMMLSTFQIARHSPMPIPEDSVKFKREWIAEVPDIMTSLQADFEFTNSPNDFIPSAMLVEWLKGKQITITKLGRDINAYAIRNELENIHVKDKKVQGKTAKVWCGIKCPMMLENDPEGI